LTGDRRYFRWDQRFKVFSKLSQFALGRHERRRELLKDTACLEEYDSTGVLFYF
jgi:hypothetical protein